MALLGAPLLILLGTLVVALPVATALLWRRTRGNQVLATLQRLVMVAAAQLAAVLLVAAAANDYGYFYGSWSDLVQQLHPTSAVATSHTAGLDPVTTTSAGPTVLQVVHLPMAAWSTPVDYAKVGRLESVTLAGARSQLSSHAFVYLPPQYFQAAYRNTTFPAVEVFTGYPGNDLNLIRRLAYQDHLRAEVKAGRAKPTVLVMMRPSVAYPRDAECSDVPAGPQTETFFAQDVPADITAAYRVRPVGWGAIGDSTGGYCAVKLTLLNSYTFSAGVGLSGYYHTLQDSTTGDLWGGSLELRHLNDLEWRLAHQPQPPVSLLLTSSRGEAGPNGLLDLQKMVSLAHAPLRIDTIVLPHGGHSLSTWSRELSPALDWLSARIGGH